MDQIEQHRKMVQELVSDKFALSRVSINEMHAILGVASEAGESLDALKRAIFYDVELDRPNVNEEMADKLYYIQLWCISQDISLLDLLGMNERKLRKRFPNGFTQEDALHRDREAERAASLLDPTSDACLVEPEPDEEAYEPTYPDDFTEER